MTVCDKKKLYHGNSLKEYKERSEKIEPEKVDLCNIAVISKEDGKLEDMATTYQVIPVIPLQAEEGVEDVNLDPNSITP